MKSWDINMIYTDGFELYRIISIRARYLSYESRTMESVRLKLRIDPFEYMEKEGWEYIGRM